MAHLSIKHFVRCGMDVRKKFVVATITFTDYLGVTTYSFLLLNLFITSSASLRLPGNKKTAPST